MSNRLFKPTLLAATIALAFTSTAHASVVRGDVDYQYFRDLAENKGKFHVGATNIDIFNKQGEKIGVALKDVPMIDFAPVIRSGGFATLVRPQYLTSVEHNRGYRSVQFGDSGSEHADNHHYNYFVVSRNDYDPTGEHAVAGFTHRDYQAPRLHKLVTETAPAEQSQEKDYALYRDRSIYPIFIRAGSGTQYIQPTKDDTKQLLSDPYNYLTGGTTLNATNSSINTIVFGGTVFDDTYSPLSTNPMRGDSGSGMFAWDTRLGRWVYIATLQSGTDSFTISVMNQPEYNEKLHLSDTAGTISDNGKTLTWTPNGNTSKVTGATSELAVNLADMNQAETATINGAKPYRPREHHGKNLIIAGEGNTLNLSENINQGAGALYFNGNTTVTGATADTTWLGAGVSIDKGKNVDWHIKNPQGDRLSKIGEGTLTVKATGENLGSISVGDGTVILDQQAGENGKKSAFSELGIVSGRPTVVLNSSDQMNPNNIYFGYRGGRLDVNGNDISFNRIQNVDEGARIVNHNLSDSATVSVIGESAPKASDVVLNVWPKIDGDLYVYGVNNPAYYWLRNKTGGYPAFFPTNGTSNDTWEFIGRDLEQAKAIAAERLAARLANKVYAYNGHLGENDSTRNNGELNVRFAPELKSATLFISGGTNLNGTLSAENDGTLVLTGRPTPYARQALDENNKTINKEIIKEGDWLNRTFNATTFAAKGNGKLEVSRNVTAVNGDFKLTDNATAQIGWTDGKSQECIRADRTGVAKCEIKNLSDLDLNSWDRTTVKGDVSLSDNARFALGSKADLTGAINGTGSSFVQLDNGSTWTMTKDSTVNSLIVDNASITLNSDYAKGSTGKYNTLNIKRLAGQGQFNYLSDVAGLQSDKVIAQNASGNFKLNVKNSGAEPNHDQKLVLLTANNQSDLSVSLANAGGTVDAGTYRYELIKDGNDYVLYNPIIEKELEEKRKAEEEAKRLEEERLAKEAEAKRLAEEAEKARLAAEQAEKERQEQLAREKAEQERLEAERQAELARLEAERLEQERLAKEAEAKRLAEEAEKARLAAEQAEKERQEQLAREAEEKRLAEEKAKAEQERLEAERLEAEKQAELARQEAERLEQERLAKEAEAKRLAEEAEKARLAAEQAEKERQEQLAREAEEKRLAEEKAKAEQAERERQEQLARQEAERLEQERLAKEAEAKRLAEEAEKARLAQEEADRLAREAEEKRLAEIARQEQLAKEKAEQERLEAERQAELARQEAERLEQERLAKEAEAKRLAEEAEKARLAQAEADRLAKEAAANAAQIAVNVANQKAKEQAERLAKEAEEKARLAEQEAKIAKEKAEQERLEAEKQAELAHQAELARLEVEKLAKEAEAKRLAEEAEKARLAKEEADRLAREAEEKAKAEQAERERQAELARQEAERLEQERLAKEAEAKRIIAENEKAIELELARQKAVAEAKAKAEAEKLAQEQAEQERLAREAEEKAKAEQAEKERLAAEQAERERQEQLAREQAEKERLEAERLEAEKLEAEKQAELARLEAERLAKEAQEKADKLAQELATRKQNELISRYSNAAISEIATTTQGLLAIGHQHLLDEHKKPIEVWLDNQWTDTKHQSDLHRGYQQKSHLLQVGIDGQLDDANQWRTGLVVSQLKADNQFDQATGKTNIRQITGYVKHAADNGVFGVFEVGAGKADSQISIDGTKQDISRDVGFVGALVGTNYQGAINIKPHAGVRAYRYSDAHYSLSQAQVVAKASNIINAYAGVEFNKAFVVGETIVHPSFSTTYHHNQADFDVKVNNHQVKQEIGNHINHELAIKWQATDKLSTTLHAGVAYGKELQSQGYGGVQVKFGW